MKKTLGVLIVLVVAGVIIPGSAVAGDVLVYPAKGQSDQQMQKDETECSEWGSQQTGFDPTAEAPPAPDGQQQKTTTSAGKGAAKGAAVGAAVGVISHDHNPWDHDALEGAAKGAVVGGVVGGLRKHHKKKKQKKQQEQEKEYQQYLDALKQYNRAYGTCLGGRGYTVTM